MRIQPQVNGQSVVLLGSFNPSIFQPEWFRRNGIIGDKDVDAATVGIIHESITDFRLEWAGIRVEQGRFIIETTQPPFIRIHDIILKTFKQFLPHTPVSQLGINRTVHFSVGDFEIRDKIGRLLAPHDAWGDWGPKISGDQANPLVRGGMRSLLMSQIDRGDGFKGGISAKIEPSVVLPKDGIYMDCNDHYIVGDLDSIMGSEEAMKIIESQWEISLNRSEHIIDQIMALKERVK